MAVSRKQSKSPPHVRGSHSATSGHAVLAAPPSPARRVPKAADLLAADLRQRILGDGLPPGAPLPSEPQIIARWRLSRATVREAFRLLEAEGLIEIRRGPRGGVRVRHPEPAHVARSLTPLFTLAGARWRDLFAFRKLIEPAAAAAAATRASEKQRAALLAAAGQAVNGQIQRHYDFHVLLAQSSDNPLLSVVMTAVEQAVHGLAAHPDAEEWDIRGFAADHQQIAAAVAARDAARASRLMSRHLDKFEAQVAKRGGLDHPLLPRSHWRAAAEHGAVAS
jgi:GntR family transcriptional regulator, transcriptional repressor for pyruvate dehydrogenase complex